MSGEVLGEFATTHLIAWVRMAAKISVALLLMDLLLAWGSPHRPDAPRPLAAARRWCAAHPWPVLLAGLVAIALVSWPGPHLMMPDRLRTLRETMTGWRETGELLTYRADDGLHRGTRGDDAAIYLMAPALAALGLPAEALRPALALLGALVAGSVWCTMVGVARRGPFGPYAALAALPAVLVLAQHWQRSGDIYWVPGAVAVAGCAMLVTEARGAATRRRMAASWLAFGLLGGIATLFRLTASVIAAAVITVAALWRWREPMGPRLVRLVALAVVLLLPRLVVRGAEARRDAALAARPGMAGPMPSEHLFWHSIYIGMGVAPNPYGLVYKDSIARNYVRGVAPQAAYMSAPYERILHDRVVSLVSTDPGFVIRQLLVKLVLVSALLLSLLAYVPALRRLRARGVALPLMAAMLACLGAGLLPGFLVVPIEPYIVGAVSTLLAFGVVLVYLSHVQPPIPLATNVGQRA